MNLWYKLLKIWQQTWRANSLKGFVSLVLVGTVLSVFLAACSGTKSSNSPDKKGNVELTLVSYAVTKAAHAAIIPKFVEKWQRKMGGDMRCDVHVNRSKKLQWKMEGIPCTKPNPPRPKTLIK